MRLFFGVSAADPEAVEPVPDWSVPVLASGEGIAAMLDVSRTVSFHPVPVRNCTQ
jgi:hypothetical protein